MSSVAVASTTSSTSSIVTMPISMPAGVGHRERHAIVRAKRRNRGFLIIGRFERDEVPVHELRDRNVERRQQELADPDVVDERTLLVDHVDDVERFAVLAVRSDVVEHLADGPMLPDRHVVGRHQSPDRILRGSRAATERPIAPPA